MGIPTDTHHVCWLPSTNIDPAMSLESSCFWYGEVPFFDTYFNGPFQTGKHRKHFLEKHQEMIDL